MNIIALSNNLYNNTELFAKKGFAIINNKNELNLENLSRLKPEYIFFPHWSHIIPEEIYENFNCIIFHMTDLPFGRGGSPLQNLIERGIYETKISAIKCVKEIDAGDVYLKKDFSIKTGSAKEIYLRASNVISEMIDEITKKSLTPTKQQGEVTLFKRRTPEMSDMANLGNLTQIYDYIRMLDCDNYPKAYLKVNNIKYEFFNVKIEDNKLVAKVEISEDYE